MKKKLGIGILIAVFVLLMAGAAALYARLTQTQAAQPIVTQTPITPAPTTRMDETDAPTSTAKTAETDAPREVAGPMPKADLAPVFTVYADDGTAVRLSDMRGKPTIVNFFASWCGPCRSEMPHFDEAYKAYGEEITFMMVDLCAFGNDRKEDAKALVEQGGWTFPVYFDTEGEAATAYAVRSMPTTIFLTADGVLAGKRIGALSQAQLQQEIDNLLSN